MIKIISLKDHFLAWAAAAGGLGPEERARLFMREVAAPNEPYYEALLFDELPGTEGRLKLAAAGTAGYYENRAELAEAFDHVTAALGPLSDRFLGMFPDCRQDMTLVVMPSLGRFDGREKYADGKAIAGFGAERFRGAGWEKELSLTAAHEMFHLYHGAKSGIWQTPLKPVLTWLWADGLATYASRQFTPGATDGDALADDGLALACSASFRDFHKVISPALLSTDAGDRRALFYGGRSYKGLPARAGYGLGLIAVRQLAAQGFTLEQMSAWTEEKASAGLTALFSSW